MSEWPQYLLKHYILYHDLVAKVIIVLNEPVKKTRGHQRTLDCVPATSGELIAHMLPAVQNSLHILFSEENRREPERWQDFKEAKLGGTWFAQSRYF